VEAAVNAPRIVLLLLLLLVLLSMLLVVLLPIFRSVVVVVEGEMEGGIERGTTVCRAAGRGSPDC